MSLLKVTSSILTVWLVPNLKTVSKMRFKITEENEIHLLQLYENVIYLTEL